MKNKISGIKNGFLIISCFFSSSGIAEITLDGSMGNAGALNGPDYQIKENQGSRVGNNLFHSFGRFNINNTESATFSGSSGINNVIGRVTGGHASNIDGTLRVTIPEANLFLLNPAGIMFGNNAKLDVPGSFHASTADSLKFQDGIRFNSRETSTNPILSTAAPQAFGFLEEKPAGISLTGGNNTVLEVDSGNTLSLLGGDISIKDASLVAPGGQVNLVSLGATGEVGITESGLDTTLLEKMGNINISQDPLTSQLTEGKDLTLANVDVSADAAGKVFIRGGQMVMENASIKSNTTNSDGGGIDVGLTGDLTIHGIPETSDVEITTQSGITADTQGQGNAGNIVLDVEGLKLTHGTRIDSSSTSAGKGGDLIINANSIVLEGNDSKAVPRLVTGTIGAGNAGNIDVTATDVVVNKGGFIRSFTTAEGNTGAININTASLTVHDRAQINSKVTETALGNSDELTINASNSIEIYDNAIIANDTDGKGNSGSIEINTGSLQIHDSGQIYNQVTETAEGDSGDLSINASNSIDLYNNAFIYNSTSGKGNSGDLTINTINLNASNGTFISNSVFENATGKGGNININVTDTIFLSGPFGGILNQAYGGGDSGNLTITSDKLEVRNGAEISTSIRSSGNSGDLLINSKEIVLTNDEILIPEGFEGPLPTGINAQILDVSKDGSATGNSGNLTVKTDNLLISNGAEISTTNGGQGNSGELLVESDKILLTTDLELEKQLNRGGIKAGLAKGDFGNSGNLTVNADVLLVENGTDISTSNAGAGQSGNLLVNADTIILSRNGDLQRTGILNTNHRTGSLGKLTVISDNLQILNGAEVNAATRGEGNGGTLNINSKSILLSGDGSNISAQTLLSTGDAGDLSIFTEHLELSDGANVNTSTSGFGLGGNLSVDAQSILLSGKDTELTSSSGIISTGNAGELSIVTDHLEMYDGASVSAKTSGFGLGGSLDIVAQSILLSGEGTRLTTSSEIASSRNAGDLTLTSDFLDISAGARIDARTQSQGVSAFKDIVAANPETFSIIDLTTLPLDEFQNSIGNGGELTLNVALLNMSESAVISADTFANGLGGKLTVNTERLNIHDSAVISASTFANGDGGNLVVNAQSILIEGDQSGNFTGISSQANSQGSGNAGDLLINTDSLDVGNDARISASTFGRGQAGNLVIDANNILLHNAKLQSASVFENIDISENSGKAMSGNIEITVNDRLQLENKASISVKTEKANAGMIKIAGQGLLKLTDDSEIITSVAGGEGIGGDISINTAFVVLDGSSIKAQAVEGAGGNIVISGFLFKSPLSVVSASSELSMDGEVRLKPDTNISGSITELPDTLMDTSNQLSERCAARVQTDLSSFVIKGNDKRPYKPGDLAPSNINDYTGVESISLENSESPDSSFFSLENNYPLQMAVGCGE